MSTPQNAGPVLRTARSRMKHRDQRGFYADLQDAGLTPDVTTDIDTARPAPRNVAELLGIEPGTPVLARARHMATDGTALQLATTYFSPSITAEVPQLAEQNTGPGGMYSRMEDAGHQLAQADELTARAPTAQEAEALRVDSSEPVILIIRMTVDADSGAVLEVTEVTAVASRNRFLYNVS